MTQALENDSIYHKDMMLYDGIYQRHICFMVVYNTKTHLLNDGICDKDMMLYDGTYHKDMFAYDGMFAL